MTDVNLPAPPSGDDSNRNSNRLLGIAAAVVVLVGLALAVAIVLGRSTNGGDVVVGDSNKGPAGTVVADGSVEQGTVTVTGEPLPEFGGSPDAAVGLVPPNLEGQNFAGQPASITDDGTPKVVMFLAHWCPHCQLEVPRVQALLDENGMPTGVSLYAVPTGTVAERSNYPPSDWLVAAGWTVPVLVDDADGTAASAWGLRSYPYFVAVAAAGTVVKRASGELTAAQFYELVDAARAG